MKEMIRLSLIRAVEEAERVFEMSMAFDSTADPGQRLILAFGSVKYSTLACERFKAALLATEFHKTPPEDSVHTMLSEAAVFVEKAFAESAHMTKTLFDEVENKSKNTN